MRNDLGAGNKELRLGTKQPGVKEQLCRKLFGKLFGNTPWYAGVKHPATLLNILVLIVFNRIFRVFYYWNEQKQVTKVKINKWDYIKVKSSVQPRK